MSGQEGELDLGATVRLPGASSLPPPETALRLFHGSSTLVLLVNGQAGKTPSSVKWSNTMGLFPAGGLTVLGSFLTVSDLLSTPECQVFMALVNLLDERCCRGFSARGRRSSPVPAALR